MALQAESFTARLTPIDCISAMWLAVTVHETLRRHAIHCKTRYAVDHGGTPAVQVLSPDLERSGLVRAEVDGIMAIVEHDDESDYLCVHETPEHRALALAVG